MKKILIVAGGTGGHIFPALAVANECQNQSIEVHWLGSRVGLEQCLVSPHYPISYISMHRVRRSVWVAKLLAPMRLLTATWQAIRIVRKQKPDVVLGMGGFVSGPAGLAARLLRIPLVIHEQNSKAGYANRILMRFADTVLTGFPEAFPKNVNVHFIGNPVRKKISAILAPAKRFQNRQDDHLRLLILGGSQGASAINNGMIAAVKTFSEKNKLSIWHQTGKRDYRHVLSDYQRLSINAKTEAFIDDIASAYSWADLVVCRSGALTVSEIAAAGIASILVPYPYAVDEHQLYNGRYLETVGAAFLIPQKELTTERLNELFNGFLNDRDTLQVMAENAKKLSKSDATKCVVRACLRLVN